MPEIITDTQEVSALTRKFALAKRRADKAKDAMDDLRGTILALVGPGYSDANIKIEGRQTLVLDGALTKALTSFGRLAECQKTSLSASKVKAVASIDPRVEKRLRFKPGSAIKVL